MGLIEKIEILKDKTKFLQRQLIQIMGKIARKSKFLGHLRAKLKKFTANNFFESDSELWGFNWLKLVVKLKII